jgi:hypothetical protein
MTDENQCEQARIENGKFRVGSNPSLGWMLMAANHGDRIVIRVDQRDSGAPNYARPTHEAARALGHWLLANTADRKLKST